MKTIKRIQDLMSMRENKSLEKSFLDLPGILFPSKGWGSRMGMDKLLESKRQLEQINEAGETRN